MTKPRALGNRARESVSETRVLSRLGQQLCNQLVYHLEHGNQLRALRAASDVKAILANIETNMVVTLNGGKDE